MKTTLVTRAGPPLWTLPILLLAPLAAWAAEAPPTASAPSSAPATSSAPAASQPANDSRPRIAVAGFDPDPNGDSRDAWIPTACEEILTWRLRRVPALVTLPTIRLEQGRQELDSPEAAPTPWDRVARQLGAQFIIGGACQGTADEVTLSLTLSPCGGESPPAQRTTLPAARLFDALDQATRWVLERLNVGPLEPATQERVFAAPSRSVSAVEYYARAVRALRDGRPADAYRYADEAVGADGRYRPPLGLLAQLDLLRGAAGAPVAGRRLRVLSDLARLDGDELDRANSELAQSMLLHADGSSEAARIRAETALEMAAGLGDVYGQIAALSWLCEVHANWAVPGGGAVTPEDRRNQQRGHLQQALMWQQRHLELLSAVGDQIGSLPASNRAAMIQDRLGDADAALVSHQRTLRLAQSLGSRRQEATAWLYVGQCQRQRGAYAEAIDAMTRCLNLADDSTRPLVRIALAGVYQAMSQPEAALDQYQQACAPLRQSNDLLNQFTCLREVAKLQKELGRRKEALAAMQEAVDIAGALELPEREALRKELADWQSQR